MSQNPDNKIDYDEEPVLYCTRCLSIRIRDIEHIEGTEYCDDCGSSDIELTDIHTWDKLYVQRYGHKYLEEK